RHKTPIAAVGTEVAIVAHGEVLARRHHDVAVLYVLRQLLHPVGVSGPKAEIGEVVAEVFHVTDFMNGLRLVERLAVAEHTFALEVNAISRQADDALHQISARVPRMAEDDDLSMVDGTIRQQPTPQAG